MVIDGPPPDEGIPVCIRLNLRPIDIGHKQPEASVHRLLRKKRQTHDDENTALPSSVFAKGR